MRYHPSRCSHLTAEDHSGVSHTGKRLWTCSLCGKIAPWDEAWSYFGNVECPNCWTAHIDYVCCSAACRDRLRWYLALEEYPYVQD